MTSPNLRIYQVRICQARCEYVDCDRRKINQFIYPDGGGSLKERNFSCPSCNRLMRATRKVGMVPALELQNEGNNK